VNEGQAVQAGTTLVKLSGLAHSLLIGERPALNFLGRLSGIATQTYEWTKCLEASPSCRLVDTRKTTPGWRALEKAAVLAGGGGNHRMGLFDGILIKENHILAAGGLEHAIQRAKDGRHHLVKIEVETTNLDEVKRALVMGVDALMLDNMNNDTMAQAIAMIREHQSSDQQPIIIEASGNMTSERLASVGALGVDLVSMGALTHSAISADVSMRFQWESA
jgi:nicotinate-nucleotide pyrophosphorylase (carboxylating)